MSNLILHTEDFTDAEWTNNATITPGFAPAPAEFGSGAALATKFEDATAVAQANIIGTYYSVPTNSTVIGSMFVLKDAVTARQPAFAMTLFGGTRTDTGVILNTLSGVASVPTGDGSPPTSFGVIDYNSLYWRIWVKQTDVGNNTDARFFFSPASYDNFGDFASSALTGWFVGWGANLTVSATVQPYEPAPVYVFGTRNIMSRIHRVH